jgi:LmbE family N-acetylglucosaminyl deacetylase
MDTKATFEELEAGLAPEPTPTRRQRRGRKFVKALGLSALLFWGFSRIGHVDQPEFFAKDVSTVIHAFSPSFTLHTQRF